MKVFLSWSGEKSRRVGEAFRKWLPNVHQQIEVFFSPEDIEKGAKWASEIDGQIRESQYCIVCLTGEALQSPWINFEAGAISKGIGQNRISPILLDLTKSDVSGPLALFQLADFEKEEIRKVLKSINSSLEDQRLSDEILDRAFSRWWPDLESEVITILKDSPSKKIPGKTQKELTDEILPQYARNHKASRAQPRSKQSRHCCYGQYQQRPYQYLQSRRCRRIQRACSQNS